MAKFETKYYIDGYSLKEYCYKYGYSYSSARNLISSNKKKHSEWTNEEILKDVVERLKKGKTKYVFGTTSLHKYCRDNDKVYSTIRRKVAKKMIVQNDSSKLNVIMTEAIQSSERGREKYAVDNILLSDYCKENNINKGSIISSISCYKRAHPESDLSDDEIAKRVLDHYRSGYVTYYVDKEPFANYVIKLGYNPSSVLRKMKVLFPQLFSSSRKINLDKEAVDATLSALMNPNGTLYFVGDISLKLYCEQNNLNYSSIIDTINKYPDVSLDHIIQKAVSNRDKRIRQKARIIIKQNEKDENFINFYINKYHIDRNCFNLAKKHFGTFTSISIIEYYGTINDDIITEVYAILEKSDPSFDECVKLNSLGFNQYAYFVVTKLEGYIINCIKDVVLDRKKYSEYKEYLEEYIYTLIVDKCYLFTPGGLLSYLKKTLKYKLIEFIQKEDGIIHSKKPVILNNSNQLADIFERDRFSALKNALKELTEFELEFIYKRFGFYGKAMSIEQLQKNFYTDYSLEELKFIEQSILQKLRINEGIKTLYR